MWQGDCRKGKRGVIEWRKVIIRASLAEQAYSLLKKAIISGKLAPRNRTDGREIS